MEQVAGTTGLNEKTDEKVEEGSNHGLEKWNKLLKSHTDEPIGWLGVV